MLADFIADCSTWLWKKMKGAGAEGYVVGISGGIDSAVAAKLAVMGVGKGKVFGYILPCRSVPEHTDRAVEVCKWLEIDYMTAGLDGVYSACMDTLYIIPKHIVALDLAKANLKPRLRMAALYFYANAMNYLVLGTGNRTELHLGYFTKYGDGGVDVEPLGGCLKGHVHNIAIELGVPEEVIKAPPSAGLWEGQTDEGEIGVKYFGQNGLDQAVRDTWTHPYGPSVETLMMVRKMHMQSEHKRHMPPIFEFDWEADIR